MSNTAKYFDARTDFFRNYYEQAKSYAEYLLSGNANEQQRWNAYSKQLSPSEAQIARIRDFRRQMPVLVLSGIWCGDCARQGPLFETIEKANPLLAFRYIDNRQNPELQKELRINGAEKVPVLVTFSEDFFELARFGDRHLSVYRRKLETELGVACDPGFGAPGSELSQELNEWIDYFERLQAMLRLSPMLRKRHGD